MITNDNDHVIESMNCSNDPKASEYENSPKIQAPQEVKDKQIECIAFKRVIHRERECRTYD